MILISGAKNALCYCVCIFRMIPKWTTILQLQRNCRSHKCAGCVFETIQNVILISFFFSERITSIKTINIILYSCLLWCCSQYTPIFLMAIIQEVFAPSAFSIFWEIGNNLRWGIWYWNQISVIYKNPDSFFIYFFRLLSVNRPYSLT